jgi:hypothetical protein
VLQEMVDAGLVTLLLDFTDRANDRMSDIVEETGTTEMIDGKVHQTYFSAHGDAQWCLPWCGALYYPYGFLKFSNLFIPL